MKKGHKEYRIFSNINIKDETEYENQLEIWRKDKTYVEERIDLYIFPLNTENDINKRFGLKFRNISIKNDFIALSSLAVALDISSSKPIRQPTVGVEFTVILGLLLSIKKRSGKTFMPSFSISSCLKPAPLSVTTIVKLFS